MTSSIMSPFSSRNHAWDTSLPIQLFSTSFFSKTSASIPIVEFFAMLEDYYGETESVQAYDSFDDTTDIA